MSELTEGVRVDVWLWSVRIFRTRSLAKSACTSGKVSVNGASAKAARKVVPGDRIEARAGGRQRILEVVATPSKRLGAQLASEAMIDHSPPAPTKNPKPLASNKPAERQPGAGRPTKRDRRQIDKFRGR